MIVRRRVVSRTPKFKQPGGESQDWLRLSCGHGLAVSAHREQVKTHRCPKCERAAEAVFRLPPKQPWKKTGEREFTRGSSKITYNYNEEPKQGGNGKVWCLWRAGERVDEFWRLRDAKAAD